MWLYCDVVGMSSLLGVLRGDKFGKFKGFREGSSFWVKF